MQISFYKYQGTGNDFIMIDNRNLFFPKQDKTLVERLCDRRFGIGADGLILLEKEEGFDFKMIYYNSDGNPSSMCGNGGRCIVAFAKKLNIITNQTKFNAIDGLHHATIDSNGIVSLQMNDVKDISIKENYVFLNTGSPHHIQMVEDISSINVDKEGASIRYSALYGASGSNVNFVQQINEKEYAIRTYERGVEGETLSCGTGATAVAIAMHALSKTQREAIQINVQGGVLEIAFEFLNEKYTNVQLKGAACFVYEGVIDC